ncbi:hypothetical protein TEA_006327 [Camellia sinensis var. sinensis]|uniref:Serine-threonine/tyrosine-protein kinase catalytic domain-containing protein n=1 Tax=Camellia sinensis var. sinensis TaxID=542762 RepID=A0A4S4DHM0_CAMSN|nr:hypothetical protein TEA_006327 [Camellia sinensis var. sinensis]
MGDMASTVGDVYSFGILLLEMFIGKRPTDNMFNFIKNTLPDRVMEIVDPCILLEHNTRRRIKTAWFPFYELGLHVQWNRQEIEWKWSVISEMHKIKTTYMNEGLNQDKEVGRGCAT